MNMLDLKKLTDRAIEHAKECGEDPSDVKVSIQIDSTKSEPLWTGDVEMTYDNNCQASGCVLHGWAEDD